ncbi:hypothetical protein PtrSN002B_010993 [Pyrenophora tritici-repentis]|nr:hypothetical protein PtrV1_05992 [Pyrenophora tritici-repentis]KAF7450733.1 hypothetical protein A1F99_053490 [Pyrenophora tritici-repentis]KAF7573374.1 hypothetical protein PtrM4_082790 [Pyrenophora tritici-repentis]KAG9381052.1 hypothetical protein A1F94_008372 [Pyrenophora tritici-repentis]KAI0570248.1 hypothetical protein Alg215_11176 [Pyrenophora tritici-repentis]
MASTSIVGPVYPAVSYKPKYDNWPYNDSDFIRYDENDDSLFYQQPRLVTHIDDPAIARLTQYYDTALPKSGKIMDMCTSWKSFYPSSIIEAIQKKELEVFGVGLNAEEMSLNSVFQDPDHWRVMDLNKPLNDVRSGWQGQGLEFDAVTCVVSIDYLNKPLQICKNLLDATKEGGRVHLVISNRCFPNKVVRRWLTLNEWCRLEFVGDYLHFSGWKDVEIVDVCAQNSRNGMRITDDQGTVTVRSASSTSHLDPLWVVRATKRG